MLWFLEVLLSIPSTPHCPSADLIEQQERLLLYFFSSDNIDRLSPQESCLLQRSHFNG